MGLMAIQCSHSDELSASLPVSLSDTDGTDGGQDDDITEHFVERFAALCTARGFNVPAAAIDAFATAVGVDFAGFDAWEHSCGTPGRSLASLAAPGTSHRGSCSNPRRITLTVIDGGRA
jgi:hypothetical protein